ncbi:MAG: GNAT family N-acetyltransferase [bacterium]
MIPLEAKILRTADRTLAIGRRDGYGPALYCLFYDAVNRVLPFSTYKVVKLRLPRLDRAYLVGPPPYRYGFLCAEEIRRFAADPENDMSETFVDDALGHGEECYAVTDGDRLAAYGWYTEEIAHVRKNIYFTFDRSYRYMHKGFTHPAYRGRRLHAIGMAKACEEYTRRGYQGFLSLVEAHNLSSLRSCYRLGYEPVGNIYTGEVLGRYRSYSDRPSRRHACFFIPLTDGSRPVS